jgi:hypothetical protein
MFPERGVFQIFSAGPVTPHYRPVEKRNFSETALDGRPMVIYIRDETLAG